MHCITVSGMSEIKPCNSNSKYFCCDLSSKVSFYDTLLSKMGFALTDTQHFWCQTSRAVTSFTTQYKYDVTSLHSTVTALLSDPPNPPLQLVFSLIQVFNTCAVGRVLHKKWCGWTPAGVHM